MATEHILDLDAVDSGEAGADAKNNQSYLYQIRVRRYVATIIALGISGLMVAVPLRTYYDTWQRNRILAQDNNYLQDRITVLQRQKVVHNDPGWLETEARRLQMVYPGERVYRLEKNTGNTLDSGKEEEKHRAKPWFSDIWEKISIPQTD